MTVMRRTGGWAFATWVPDGERGRRQVWRNGFRTKSEAAAAERRFLVEPEDGANQPGAGSPSPTVEAFLVDWLEHSAPTRRPTTSVSYDKLVRQHINPHLGTITLAALAPADIRGGTPRCSASPRRGAVRRWRRRPCGRRIGCCAGRCRTRCGGSSSTATPATP